MCFGRISADQILNNSIINFISNCVLTIVLFFMLLVKRWRGYRAFYLDLDFKIVCVLIVGAISSILFVTYTEEYGFDVEGNLREKAGAVSLIVFGSLFYLLQCIGMFFYIRNKKLVEVMALREQFLQQQKRYYTVLLAKEEETKRLQEEIKKLESEVTRCEKMLSNPGFTSKAPAQKIEEEKAKLAKYTEMLKASRERLEGIK